MEDSHNRRLGKSDEVTGSADFSLFLSGVSSCVGMQCTGALVLSSGVLMHPHKPKWDSSPWARHSDNQHLGSDCWTFIAFRFQWSLLCVLAKGQGIRSNVMFWSIGSLSVRFLVYNYQQSWNYNFDSKVACDLLIKGETLEQSCVPADGPVFQPFQSRHVHPWSTLWSGRRA